MSKVYELSLEKSFILDRKSPNDDLYQLIKGTTIEASKYLKQFTECFTKAIDFVKHSIENEIFVLLVRVG
ncbi:hypothetical protein AGMMS49531_04150 [Endomicrobiia bacterium]|nr:hypothetical protein AGMMS49531_04150 [Endomicrobiia bacterium]